MGTVIKASSATKLKNRFQRLELKDHMAEARDVLAAARTRAQSIIEQAEKDAVEIRKQAHRDAYGEGLAQGRQAGERAGREDALTQAKEEFRREQEHVVAQLNALIADLECRKRDLIEDAQRDLLAFAVMIARRIAGRTAALDRKVAVTNLNKALAHVGAWTDLVLRVHPDDAATVRSHAEEILLNARQARHVNVVEEPTIEPGGCVLETAETRVDATLEGQFAAVVNLLLGEWNQDGRNAVAQDQPAGDNEP